jgi:hypothetical protein
MKKSQLKQLLKPIIKECINETLIEQGLLSNIISEVVKGLQPAASLAAATSPSTDHEATIMESTRREMMEEQQRSLKEQKRKLLDAAGLGANIFEGTTPLAKGGSPNETAPSGADALGGVDPNDAGVDISGIAALGGRNWKKMI